MSVMNQNRPGKFFFAIFAVVAFLDAFGCRARTDRPAPPSTQPKVAYRTLGSWSGRGNKQTESFNSDTGALRIRWETKDDTKPGQGVFRLTAHSAISGRLLQEVVDQNGPGDGVAYVQQDPHVFYLVVEADQLDWAFTVDEATVYR
jgi:hypothetical protein